MRIRYRAVPGKGELSFFMKTKENYLFPRRYNAFSFALYFCLISFMLVNVLFCFPSSWSLTKKVTNEHRWEREHRKWEIDDEQSFIWQYIAAAIVSSIFQWKKRSLQKGARDESTRNVIRNKKISPPQTNLWRQDL